MKPVYPKNSTLSKGPTQPRENNCLVCQEPCSDCNFVYIGQGQTKRNRKSRLAKRKLVIKNQKRKICFVFTFYAV